MLTITACPQCHAPAEIKELDQAHCVTEEKLAVKLEKVT